MAVSQTERIRLFASTGKVLSVASPATWMTLKMARHTCCSLVCVSKLMVTRMAAQHQLPDVFLLSQSNLKDVAVLEARAAAMVAPALHYVQDRFMNKRHKQVSRFKAAQIFDPLFVQENGPVTDSDVKALKAFKFSKRPDLAKAIESMGGEISQYNKQIALIKPKAERMVTTKGKPDEKKDSFDIQSWWRANRSNFPAFARICRAVLTHLPNSCSPEAVFSILNDTFESDQESAYADYMELSLQLQFDNRTPRSITIHRQVRQANLNLIYTK